MTYEGGAGRCACSAQDGWPLLLLGVFAGCLLAAAHGLLLIACHKATLHTAMAHPC
ncbi:hypothetical protein [Streptomyces sp. NPDC046939]|uniref:hypothetical protein n=1 Tax=Streptomyces sp. NPDC046939 TaxID=3155376 RepID=UPI0033FCEC01